MPSFGMDPRILGLLTASDYMTASPNEYRAHQISIGKRCAEILYKALSEEGFRVNFTATIYEIADELVRIAAQLMFGSELEFANVKYRKEEDLHFLEISIKRCPFCEYTESKDPICYLLSGFFGRLLELFLSRFSEVKVDASEDSCTATGDPFCSFTIKWHTLIGKTWEGEHEVEIHINEQALQEKVREIEELDFFKRAVVYARQRRTDARV